MMFDLKNIEFWHIFLLVCFFTFLYKIEEMIEDESYKEKSKKVLSFLIITNTLVSAIIGTIIWITLEDMKVKFEIYDFTILLQGWINVFISITIPFFYREMIALAKRKMTVLAAKGEWYGIYFISTNCNS